jgi:glycosyltransferase involved in cell wall biosynthesis
MSSSAVRLWFLPVFNNTGFPLLMSERSSPMVIETLRWNRPERLASFAASDGIHLLSKTYLDSTPDFLHERVTIIPNPAPEAVPVNWRKEEAPRKRLLAVSRLTEIDKKLSLLIRAFSSLADEFSFWDCSICGDGRDLANYVELIRSLNLEDRVILEGAVDDVDSHYEMAHIFCMPSAYEGSPNALLEAQSHGLPSVGFALCSGVNEIIVHGENGLLAETMDAAGLARTLRPLMESVELRRKMSGKAHALLFRYDEGAIFRQWEEMLRKVARQKGRTRLNLPLPTEEERTELILREIVSRRNPLQGLDQTRVEQKRAFALTAVRANLAMKAARKECGAVS